MFTYYRIFDKYQRPIVAFALLTDAGRRFRPHAYEHSYLNTELRYVFSTYQIIDQLNGELALNDNPFAVVVQRVKIALLGKSKRMTGDRVLTLKVDLTKRLLASRFLRTKFGY